jgi:NTE family protein
MERTVQPNFEAAAPDGRRDLAIVLTGGGARSAYQVGLLRGLARHLPDLHFPIITGVSAGAINAAFFAAHTGTLAEAAVQLCDAWAELTAERIFRVDSPFLARGLVRWATHLVSGGSPAAPEVRGLLDTEPLRETIRRTAATVDGEIIGIGRNIERGRLRSLALTALNYSTGQTVTWVQGEGIEGWEQGLHKSVPARISVEHVMASAALPVFFPAVRLGHSWYGDGGVRLSAPLGPALRLGACRILAVSPQYRQSPAEAERMKAPGYPPPAQILSHLLSAIFLDVLEQDAERMHQTNQLVEKLPPGERKGKKKVEIVLVRPSEDLGRLATAYEPRLPRAFRYLTRSLGTRETASPDFLSYLMFQPDYLAKLIEIGERDAEAKLPEIRRVVLGEEAEVAFRREPGP